MPPKYILHVFSVPEKVDEDVWAHWYAREHIPDMVYTNVSETARGYRLVSNPLELPEPSNQRPFLAIYESDDPMQLFCKEYMVDCRHDSDMWEGDYSADEIGRFDIRNYRFVKEYKPRNLDDKTSSYLLHFEITPHNTEQMMAWFEGVLQDQLKQISGYRRSLLYQKGYMDRGSPGSATPPYIFLMEFENFDNLTKTLLETSQARGVMTQALTFSSRAYKVFSVHPTNFAPKEHSQVEWVPMAKTHKNPPLWRTTRTMIRQHGLWMTFYTFFQFLIHPVLYPKRKPKSA